MSRELPILFNTEKVRAILDGRKNCTRRLVKTRRKDACGFYVTRKTDGSFAGIYEYDENESMFDNPLEPPYQPGDILYVKETWCKLPIMINGTAFFFRADGDLRPIEWQGKWHPSIHMPKEAARIWLKVTDVSVERLQDITEDGAKAEGAIDNRGFIHSPDNEYDFIHTAREGFMQIWNSTIKKSDLDRYGWNVNPWVWVIEFERCEKPEGV